MGQHGRMQMFALNKQLSQQSTSLILSNKSHKLVSCMIHNIKWHYKQIKMYDISFFNQENIASFGKDGNSFYCLFFSVFC